MRRGRGLTLGLVAACLATPVVVLATATGAGAVPVSTEAELRAAFADPNETSIVLQNDIVLTDCGEGDVDRTVVGPALPPLTLDGAGFTITQTCDDGVLQTEGSLELVDVTITGGNRLVGSGGGVATGDDAIGSDLIVRRSTIVGNHAPNGGSGGGIDWIATGIVLIEDSTLSGNTAGDAGGGMRTFAEGEGSVGTTIVRSTISGNSAVAGGGIDAAQGAPMLVVNSTITDNTAELGGGILADELAIVYSTVTSNTGTDGANIAVDDVFRPFASVIASGNGAESCSATGAPIVESQGYNFSDDASCLLDADTDRQDAGDPQLGALAANGGPTLTRLPAATSPLVDAVPTGACQDDGAAGVTTDQRGVTRPQIGGCDIGAVEIEAVVPPPIVLEPTFTG